MTVQSTHHSGRCRVAIYGRYSSDLQRQSSIEDQFRVCQALVEQRSWTISETYADRAISGASLHRPSLQRLMDDARAGKFDVVLAEALDRLSRDQEDIAGLFKRLRFLGIQLMTCAEGEISELHVGLKGTLNALFLKDLAAKTHRGLVGRIREGRSGGGLTYGYDVLVEAGSNERGARKINADEAKIADRIFRDFDAGRSPIAIARQLNSEGVPGPRGGSWLDTTIRGSAIRGTGILRNELYIGRLVWNRLRYSKDPDTGKRLSRLNPPSEWVIENVPDLRIIDQGLWDSVAARLGAIRSTPSVAKKIASRFWEKRRPQHFSAGRIVCGCCGRTMAVIAKDYLGCNFARRRGTCTNRPTVRRAEIERLVLDGLKNQLMAPDAVQEFIRNFHDEVNRSRDTMSARRRAAERELPIITARVRSLVDVIAGGIRTTAIVQALEESEARKAALESELAAPPPTPVRLHPALAELYRKKVTDLQEAIHDPGLRTESVQMIQSLIDRIVIFDGPNGPEVELIGNIAAMVEVAQSSGGDNKKAARLRAALSVADASSAKVVAGAGFEPTTFRL